MTENTGDAGKANEAAQITMGRGLVDVTRIEHEGRSGILFHPRDKHIPIGQDGEMQAGEYWPAKGDVVIWVENEGGAQVVQNYLTTFLSPVEQAPQRLKNALEMTGCKDEADLIDMANVGNSLMERIDSLVKCPGSYYRWAPADDPAEIVFDLVNDLGDFNEALVKALEALKHARDQIPHPDQLIDEAIASAEALSTKEPTE